MTGNATGTVSGRVIGSVIGPGRLERAKELQAAGFVHVTGLPTCNYYDDANRACNVAAARALARHGINNGVDPDATTSIGEERYTIQAYRRSLGHCDYNNGKFVVVTPDGEVWLGTGAAAKTDVHEKYVSGRGAHVPCSNGESIEMHLLLERVADPYSDCHGSHSPIPQIRD